MTTVERTISSTSTKLTARSSTCSSASYTRKQNRSQFAKYYTDLCHLQHSHPLTAIKQNLDKGILDFNCDRIKFDEWWSIINALSCDKTLHLIAIRSRHPIKQAIETADTELKARAVTKQPVVTTRFVLLWLIESIKLCLTHSTTLTVLELEGLPLSGDYLTSLSRGIMETSSLQHLSLSKCSIGDEGTEMICHTIKHLPSVVSLDLSNCGLTNHGADIIAGLIKYQKLNRYSEAWKQTLRYRDPDVEAMPGLRRITINNNPDIGDKGMEILTEEIKDDLWLRALDVQDCGLTDEGGNRLLDLLENNTNLIIVDARGNPYMTEEKLSEIMNRLALNNRDRNNTDYKWINKSPNLNKKSFQVSSLRPRPWTCQSSVRLTARAPPASECSGVTTIRSQLRRSNTTLNQKDVFRKSENNDENERLRLQLRDLTLILNQEVRHKLVLIEENKKLKEMLEKCEEEKKKLEEAQDKKVLIAEDTLRVLEETIGRFGMYISEKQEEEEETSESTTTRSTDEHEMPELVSNIRHLLKKATSSTEQNLETNKPYQKHKEKVRHSKSDTRTGDRKLFIDLQIEDEAEKKAEARKNCLERKKKSKFYKNRAKDQIIWEEDEMGSVCGDIPRHLENSKSKAQLMFAKMLEENRNEGKRTKRVVNDVKYNQESNHQKFQDDSTSDDSDYDSKSGEVAEKPLTSSYEENSS